MMSQPSMDNQMAAWKRYADARGIADKTLSFEDGRAAVEAWIGFLNVFLPEGEQLPERRTSGGNVALFPLHKTSSSKSRSRS